MAIFETALARGPRFILEQSEALGAHRDELLRDARLSDEEIANPDARVPVARLADLWRSVVNRFPERDLGTRFGAAYSIERSGLVGYLVMNSADLGAAIERVVRFSGILNEAIRPRLELTADRAILSWVPSPFFRPYPQALDWGLAALLTCLRQATGRRFEPVEVWLTHARPRPVPPAHRSHFGRGLRFERQRAGLVLSREQLALPIEKADTELGSYLESHAEAVLRRRTSQGDLIGRVRSRIWEALRDGRPGVDKVAESLGMSGRSLQRRLRQQETSFGVLRDEMLRTLATSLLRDRGLAIHEISFLLGYSEPSTFYRAFRRWERTSPVRYRATA